MRKISSLTTKRIVKKISKRSARVLIRGANNKKGGRKMRVCDPFLMPLTGEAAIKFEEQLRNAKRHDVNKILEEGIKLSIELEKIGIVRRR